MIHDALTTGKLAALAGVNIQTLRYYERRGLLQKPPCRPSGYREYSPEAVKLIRFIKHAQQLGFTLSEIQELLRLRQDRTGSCSQVRASAQTKMADIDRKVRSLQAMKKALSVLVASCKTDRSRRECPILEALDETFQEGGLLP